VSRIDSSPALDGVEGASAKVRTRGFEFHSLDLRIRIE